MRGLLRLSARELLGGEKDCEGVERVVSLLTVEVLLGSVD